jgi:hypothetical protein
VALAKLHYALGNDKQAFDDLARSVRNYDHHMLWVVAGPGGAWSNDSRYRAILASMHLPM